MIEITARGAGENLIATAARLVGLDVLLGRVGAAYANLVNVQSHSYKCGKEDSLWI